MGKDVRKIDEVLDKMDRVLGEKIDKTPSKRGTIDLDQFRFKRKEPMPSEPSTPKREKKVKPDPLTGEKKDRKPSRISKNIKPRKLVDLDSSDEEIRDSSETEKKRNDQLLIDFDRDTKWGPSVGMSRLSRYKRAVDHGLKPPAEIRRILELRGQEYVSPDHRLAREQAGSIYEQRLLK